MAFSLVKEYHQHAHTAGSYDFAALQELEASWVPSRGLILDKSNNVMYNQNIGRTVPALSERGFLMKKRSIALLLIAVIVCSAFAGCGKSPANAEDPTQEGSGGKHIVFAEPTYETFSVEEMELKLPDRFQRQDTDSLIQFVDDNYAVLLMREAFDLYPVLKHMTIEEYGEAILEASDIDADIEMIDGLYCFEYEALALDRTTKYNYFVVLYKSKQAFWVVQFGSVFWNASAMRSEFIKWAKMITFTD